MRHMKTWVPMLALLFLMAGLFSSARVHAAPPEQGGTGLDAADTTAMLDAHNIWRQRYSVPPLVWDAGTAAVAQDWANQMAATADFRHRPNNALGENIWAGSSGFFVPSDAVNAWGNEVENYDFATDTCAVGKVCGHFTQLVWARTTRVGCGKATGFGNDYFVCNYDPPGNVGGETPGAAPAAALVVAPPTDAPTPTTQPAANLPGNTDPFSALPFNAPNQVIPGGAALWYTLPVNGGDVTVRIPTGATNALGFWVFAPTLTTGPSDGTHIGTGNVEGSDLVWTGSALEPGDYFIVVFNNTTEPVPFTITSE